MPVEGKKAPAFTLPDETGAKRALKDYQGKWVLLYFYPKDDTPGCTIEACTIRDQFKDFKKVGAQVLGVSADSMASHKKFKDAYQLPFTLLADEKRVAIEKYGAWAEKSMYGKKFMGIVRSSFLIDPKGVIRKVYAKVKPETHAGEVIKALKAFGA